MYSDHRCETRCPPSIWWHPPWREVLTASTNGSNQDFFAAKDFLDETLYPISRAYNQL